MSENNFQHWASVCFHPQDNSAEHPDAPGVGRVCWGDWLLGELEKFSTPADFAGHLNARGETVPVKIAAVPCAGTELPEGAGLGADVHAQLESSRYLIVLCSPRSAKSRAVDETVRHFKQLGRGNRILPVVIAGEPHARNASQPGLFFDDECFSPAMRHPVLPDGTVDTNRVERGYIFADARHGDDRREILAKDFANAEAGLERAKIQLIAGLIGVGFNGLWQREQKRRFAGFAEAQGQLQLAWEQTRTAQHDVAETQKLVADLQGRVRVAEGKAEEAEKQLDAARSEVRDAQKKVLDAQHLPADAKKQIEEAQAKALEAQQQVQQLRNQMRAAETQLEQARQQAQDAERKLSEAQSQAVTSQNQVQEIQSQTRDVQSQIQLAQEKVRDAEEQARAARSDLAVSRQQAHEAQAQLQSERDKTSAARRLTKVFAVLAVLAALAAGIVFSQRKPAGEDVAKISEQRASDVTTNILDSDSIRQALQQGGDLDSLAARIPKEKISETLNLAATILSDPERSKFQSQLLDVWVKTDAVAAFDWSRQLTNNEARQFALEKTVPAFTAGNMSNTLAVAEFFQTATNPPSLLAGVFGRWAEVDLKSASAACTALPVGANREAVSATLLPQFIAQSPAEAAALVTEFPPGDLRRQRIAETGRSWGLHDATNALAWAETLPAEGDRTVAMNEILGSWTKTDLPAVTNWLADLPEVKRAAALPAITSARVGSATNGFDLALNFLRPFADDESGRKLLELAAQDSASSNPAATADAIAAMPAGDDQKAAIKGLVSKWLTVAPEPALDWLRAFPETNAQPEQIQFVLKTWSQSEPAVAAQWLTNQPSGSASEAMFATFLDGAVVKYPEFAAQWTQSVADETQRQKFQVQVARQWLKTDAVAAQKWIDTLDLPAKVKKVLKP